jgi:hypothetical protein
MGLSDVFGKEERVEVTYSDFYQLFKSSAKLELLENAVKARVPHHYIEGMLDGQIHTEEVNTDVE